MMATLEFNELKLQIFISCLASIIETEPILSALPVKTFEKI